MVPNQIDGDLFASQVQFKERALADSNDWVLVELPHPTAQGRTGVYLRNLNGQRGIVASIRIDATYSLRIEAGTRMASRARWPVHHLVTVPPSTDVLLGIKEETVWREVIGLEVQRDSVVQRFSVQGAYYKDAPFPQPIEKPEDNVWFYSVPMIQSRIGDTIDVVVNLHPNRFIEIEGRYGPENDEFLFKVPPHSFHIARYGYSKGIFFIEKSKFLD